LHKEERAKEPKMTKTPAEIAKQWKTEGKSFRTADLVAEFNRQAAAERRAQEDAILAHPERHSADLVQSVRDHRA
jgi:hypothetical protein